MAITWTHRVRVALLAQGLASVVLVNGLGAQNRLFMHLGRSLEDHFGASVAGVGDVNRDGVPDYVIGAPEDRRAGTRPGSVRVFSGRDGSVLYTFFGTAGGDRFGFSVDRAGDVNLDGVPDILIGAPQGSRRPGYVQIRSGLDGMLLWTFRGDAPGDAFGACVSEAGFVDRDRHPDVLVGAPGSLAGRGFARVHAGWDGRAIWLARGTSPGDQLGFSLDGGSDFDRDGRADIVVGAPGEDSPAVDAGRASVLSGRDGKVLWTTAGSAPYDRLGYSVSAAGDANRDGWIDWVVGAPSVSTRGTHPGFARVMSGQDGKTLWSLPGRAFSMTGIGVGGIGDWNGDGYADIAVGARNVLGGGVRVLSGANRGLLHLLYAPNPVTAPVAGVGDLNLDGFADMIVGSPLYRVQGAYKGQAQVITGNHVALTPDKTTLSVRQGGFQRLFLDARPALAGKLYLVLGSLNGTRPGIRFHPVHPIWLPVNPIIPPSDGPDPWFRLSLAFPNTTVFTNTFGLLDRKGTSWSFLRFPPGAIPRSLVGVSFDHAFLVFDGARVVFASNAAPLKIVP